jgi:hypothetical protein
MNIIRERILLGKTPYKNMSEHKDLIAISVCAECFTDYEDEDNGIEADFEEVIAIIEKEWLFNKMKREGISNPLEYLQNEYTSDDSIDWYDEANAKGKIVMIAFN